MNKTVDWIFQFLTILVNCKKKYIFKDFEKLQSLLQIHEISGLWEFNTCFLNLSLYHFIHQICNINSLCSFILVYSFILTLLAEPQQTRLSHCHRMKYRSENISILRLNISCIVISNKENSGRIASWSLGKFKHSLKKKSPSDIDNAWVEKYL